MTPLASVDYIVVGSGSAGAIVAARLAEDPATSVLLLEAGPKDTSLLFHIPTAMRYAYDAPKYNWSYVTEPEPHLNDRRVKMPRGRVLGGSSSINGQLYLRGHPLDYEGWEEAGARGWSFGDVLPYFKRLETRVDGASEHRGSDGPIKASTSPPGPLEDAFLEAGAEAGYLTTDDVNGAQQDGFGLFPKNVAFGRRSSTSQCYLRNRPKNLQVLTGCHATRLVLEGRIARGVEYERAGRLNTVSARREVVVCCGVFNSPMLLMRSGIGPAAHLREHGLTVVHDLPGVGENLQDHPLTAVQVSCKQPVTLYKHLNLMSQAKALLEWLLMRRRLLANNHFNAVAFIRSKAGIRFPNLQIALLGIAVAEGSAEFMKQHAFQLQLSNQRPLSRGHVELSSPDPYAAPLIRTNMLQHPADVDELKTGFRLTREFLRQPALSVYAGQEIYPGDDLQTDAELESWIRETCYSSYHPCGTCKMGTDELAFVDPKCRVRGIERLRVADASIMPIIPSANLNCPTMMIGEKAADLIAGKQPLPSLELAYFADPRWETDQR